MLVKITLFVDAAFVDVSMCNMKRRKAIPRSYQMTARAASAEATGDRILEAFKKRICEEWFEDITLDKIARDADVTVMTVIRRFGSKQGLLEAVRVKLGKDVMMRRDLRPGDIDFTAEGVCRDYEEAGTMVLHLLAQEDRHPVIKEMTDHGRRGHREWLAKVFDQALMKLPAAKRTALLDRLVVATDLWVWKLVRLEMGRPPAAFKAMIKAMMRSALRDAEENP